MSTGISDIDETLIPRPKSMLPPGIWPRVIPGYAILLWFTYQITIIVNTYIHNYGNNGIYDRF